MHNAITALCYHHTTSTGDHRGTRPRRPTPCNPSLSSPYPPGKPKTRPAHPILCYPLTRGTRTVFPGLRPPTRSNAPLARSPPTSQLSNFPTNRQADKLASWQAPAVQRGGGEPPSVTWSVHHTPSNTPHPRNPHLHHQPVPAASFLSYPAEPPPARPRPDAYPHHHTLARLLISRPPAEPRAHPFLTTPAPNAAKPPTLAAWLRSPPTLCNECTMQSLQTAITCPPLPRNPPNPPLRQPLAHPSNPPVTRRLYSPHSVPALAASFFTTTGGGKAEQPSPPRKRG